MAIPMTNFKPLVFLFAIGFYASPTSSGPIERSDAEVTKILAEVLGEAEVAEPPKTKTTIEHTNNGNFSTVCWIETTTIAEPENGPITGYKEYSVVLKTPSDIPKAEQNDREADEYAVVDENTHETNILKFVTESQIDGVTYKKNRTLKCGSGNDLTETLKESPKKKTLEIKVGPKDVMKPSITIKRVKLEDAPDKDGPTTNKGNKSRRISVAKERSFDKTEDNEATEEPSGTTIAPTTTEQDDSKGEGSKVGGEPGEDDLGEQQRTTSLPWPEERVEESYENTTPNLGENVTDEPKSETAGETEANAVSRSFDERKKPQNALGKTPNFGYLPNYHHPSQSQFNIVPSYYNHQPYAPVSFSPPPLQFYPGHHQQRQQIPQRSFHQNRNLNTPDWSQWMNPKFRNYPAIRPIPINNFGGQVNRGFDFSSAKDGLMSKISSIVPAVQSKFSDSVDGLKKNFAKLKDMVVGGSSSDSPTTEAAIEPAEKTPEAPEEKSAEAMKPKARLFAGPSSPEPTNPQELPEPSQESAESEESGESGESGEPGQSEESEESGESDGSDGSEESRESGESDESEESGEDDECPEDSDKVHIKLTMNLDNGQEVTTSPLELDPNAIYQTSGVTGELSSALAEIKRFLRKNKKKCSKNKAQVSLAGRLFENQNWMDDKGVIDKNYALDQRGFGEVGMMPNGNVRLSSNQPMNLGFNPLPSGYEFPQYQGGNEPY